MADPKTKRKHSHKHRSNLDEGSKLSEGLYPVKKSSSKHTAAPVYSTYPMPAHNMGSMTGYNPGNNYNPAGNTYNPGNNYNPAGNTYNPGNNYNPAGNTYNPHYNPTPNTMPMGPIAPSQAVPYNSIIPME